MKTTRRDFLKQSSSAILGASAAGLLAPSRARADEGALADPPTLVVVYLRGGADSLNTVVPFADPLYYEVRPTIAIARPGAEEGSLPLDARFGLHPALAPLHAFFEQGSFAPIVNVGSPHSTRSHFDAQDFMEYAAPGVRTITEGWLNRFLSMTHEGRKKEAELRALAMQPLLPRSLRGEFPVLAVPEIGATAAMDAFESLYMCEKGSKDGEGKMAVRADASNIVEAGQNTIRTLRRFHEITSGARGPENGAKYPSGALGEQLRKIAQVVKAGCGLEIAAVDYNGWDHHARQGGVQGTMSNMLANVAAAMSAFATDLGPERMKKVLVLTMSEFGRTVKENGNEGSDHGHGGFMMALGGMVNGGRVYGEWTGLEAASLYDGRDMPVTTDFRLVFLEVLYRLFAMRGKLDKFFPDWRPEAKALEFLRQV